MGFNLAFKGLIHTIFWLIESTEVNPYDVKIGFYIPVLFHWKHTFVWTERIFRLKYWKLHIKRHIWKFSVLWNWVKFSTVVSLRLLKYAKPVVVKSEWEMDHIYFPLSLDNGRLPHGYINQRLQHRLELLMMNGVHLEKWWAFNKLWNNKFYYKAASCWYFYWILRVLYTFMNIYGS
jgi:hypothetical protein